MKIAQNYANHILIVVSHYLRLQNVDFFAGKYYLIRKNSHPQLAKNNPKPKIDNPKPDKSNLILENNNPKPKKVNP